MLEAKRNKQPKASSLSSPGGVESTVDATRTAYFFDPDVDRAPMSWSGLVSAAETDSPDSSSSSSSSSSILPYEVYNTTGADLLQRILRSAESDGVAGGGGELAYWFEKLPASLVPDIASVSKLLFLRESDLERYEQYMWFSSAGVRMHTHVDADHNFFLQVAGRKRWTLYPTAEAAEMHPFPRTHPLWHKAQRSPSSTQPTLRFPVSQYATAVSPLSVLSLLSAFLLDCVDNRKRMSVACRLYDHQWLCPHMPWAVVVLAAFRTRHPLRLLSWLMSSLATCCTYHRTRGTQSRRCHLPSRSRRGPTSPTFGHS